MTGPYGPGLEERPGKARARPGTGFRAMLELRPVLSTGELCHCPRAEPRPHQEAAMSGNESYAVEHSGVVRAPAATIYRLVADLAAWPRVFPNILHAEPLHS